MNPAKRGKWVQLKANFKHFKRRNISHLCHLLAAHPQQVSVSDAQDLVPATETLILTNIPSYSQYHIEI